jgi:NAD(P)-dependent dehydrogenase (short-subunit alcohol dehydrogenase family)
LKQQRIRRPASPHIRAGGHSCAIVITSSTAGRYGGVADGNPGGMGYIASKHGVVGLMRAWANALAPERIRVNTVRPTGVNSPMITTEVFGQFVREFPTIAANLQNPRQVENGLIEPEDVTIKILHLVSDTGRYITGSTVLVDAGFTNKSPPGEGPTAGTTLVRFVVGEINDGPRRAT